MVIPLHDWIISICLCACLLHHNWHQWKVLVLVLVLVGAHSALLAAGYIHAVLLLSVQLPFVWLIYLFSCTLSGGMSCLLSVELPHCHWVVNWWWWRWSAWDAGWFNCLSRGCTGLPWGWWQCTVCVWLLVEPLLLSFDVALLLLEPILLEESPVSMVDKESGLLSDVPLSSATLLSAFKPVSGTLSWSSWLSMVSCFGWEEQVWVSRIECWWW